MKTIESFLHAATKAPDSKIADEYNTALTDADKASMRLIRYLRIDKDGKPCFSDGVTTVMFDLECADERLQTITMDIAEYLSLVGDYDSVQQMVEKLARLRRTVDNLNHDVNGLSKQAVNKGTEPRDDPAVQAAADKRDRVVSETKAEIQDLSQRIQKAKELVGRY